MLFAVSNRRNDERLPYRNAPTRGGHRYPQPTVLGSLLDRRLMGLADRGGSSGYVGHAWGEFCQHWLMGNIGQALSVGPDIQGTLDSVVVIDAIPGLAAFASSRGLQNPDFALTLSTDDGAVLVAADAKFSIETAKPRQVSAEILTALIETPGTPVRAHVRMSGAERDGFFITPDYELTQLVMNGTTGILKTAVSSDQVCLLHADPAELLRRPDLQALIDGLESVDQGFSAWRSDLVAALYYCRCAFACIGCRIDETKPLLGRSEVKEIDDPGLLPELLRRGERSASAWELVQRWDRDAEEVRAIRIQVHQAADIGIANRDIRTMVERESQRLGKPAPSVNRVRRELALWTDAELVGRFGTVFHPVPNLSRFIADLRGAIEELRPRVPAQVRAIVEGLPPL